MDGVERIPIISHSNQNESESTVPSMGKLYTFFLSLYKFISLGLL